MNSNREDYLQTIYRLSLEKGYTKNKDIAEYLGISKASVSEMLKKLETDGMVEFSGTKVTLSDEGIVFAEKLLSVHRLWEYFLYNILKMPESEIHEQADLLEHVTGPKLREALNCFLDYPTSSPGGKSIYKNIEQH